MTSDLSILEQVYLEVFKQMIDSEYFNLNNKNINFRLPKISPKKGKGTFIPLIG